MDYELIIFDVDGTLVTTKSGATFRTSADDWQWLPGCLEKLQELEKQGILTATATNQGGVAYGYMTEGAMFPELTRMGNEGNFDTMRVCYMHPHASIEQYRANDTRRKPGPGMLLEIMGELEVGPTHTLMVGDRPEDSDAARNAGVAFMWADEFFREDV